MRATEGNSAPSITTTSNSSTFIYSNSHHNFFFNFFFFRHFGTIPELEMFGCWIQNNYTKTESNILFIYVQVKTLTWWSSYCRFQKPAHEQLDRALFTGCTILIKPRELNYYFCSKLAVQKQLSELQQGKLNKIKQLSNYNSKWNFSFKVLHP